MAKQKNPFCLSVLGQAIRHMLLITFFLISSNYEIFAENGIYYIFFK